MSGNDKDKTGKASVLDKIKKLINATEPDEMQLRNNDHSGREIDADKDRDPENKDGRPIMEEIFSDSGRKIKENKTNPLTYEDKISEAKRAALHLHEIKLEEVKKEYHVKSRTDDSISTQESAQTGEQRQAANQESPVKGETQAHKDMPALKEPIEIEPNDTGPVPAVGQAEENTQTEPAEEPKQERAQAEPTAEPSEKEETAARRQESSAPAGEKAPDQTENTPAAQQKDSPVQTDETKKTGAAAGAIKTEELAPPEKEKKQEENIDPSPVLAEKRETVFAKLSGMSRAFVGFINAKPDEYAPDEDEDVTIAQFHTEQENTEPTSIMQKKPAKKEKKPEQSTAVTEKSAQQDQQVAAILEQARRDGKTAAEKIKKEEKEPPVKKQYADFVKMSVQHLPEDQAEKMIVNGVRVPEYIHENDVKKIVLAGDKFQHTIKKEYEEYLKLEIFKETVEKKAQKEEKTPEKSVRKQKNAEKKEESPVSPADEEEAERKSLKDKLFGSYENAPDYSEFSVAHTQEEEVIEDFDRPEDVRAVRAEINMETRKLQMRTVITGIAFVLALVVTALQKNIPAVLTEAIPNVDIMFCIVNLLLLALGIALCHITVLNGLRPLFTFRGNSDTAFAVAAIAAATQGVLTFFDAGAYFSGEKNSYAMLVLFALFLNSMGKLWIQLRIRDNFKFIAAPNRKYAVKILNDGELAEKMLVGTKADKPIVAFQRRTKFLKNFLKLSYTPDPVENTASKFAPVCTVCAVLVAIVYGIITKNAVDAVSAFTVVACMGIPVCCLLAFNIPMRRLCRSAVKNNAMVVGYPAVKQFSDTRALMIDSRELYPRGRVELLAVKTFNAYNIDKALIGAAAVMKVANTPMTYMFEDVICDRGEELPPVESVKYEDSKGLVCWVSGERILIGTRDLMGKYSIDLPSLDFEESNREDEDNSITYIASSGQLVAMLVTHYTADKRIVNELKRLENNDVTLLIRTADPNVTQEKVARDFKLYYRSIKILPTSLGNICKEEMSEKEESSRAYLSTRGKIASLARAVAGCIKIKNNIPIAIFIQFAAVILGILLVSSVVVMAGLKGLGAMELFFYMLFWSAASVIAPLIRKP